MARKKIDDIMQKAKETVTENEKVKGLLADVKRKLDKVALDAEERSDFIYQVQVFVRMIRAHFNGSYKAFSTPTIISMVFGLLYFITPTDLIPDFIPVLGFTDDVSLIYFIFKNLAEDISRFREWEEEMEF